MTVESLMNTFTKYAWWLYSEREWAGWELQTIAITIMVLLLFFLIQWRKAKSRKANTNQSKERPSTVGISFDPFEGISQGFKGNVKNQLKLSIPKNNGKHKRWKETTKKLKNYQKLIEQLQQETVRYKQAEEHLEQQFARLKSANEQLRQAIGTNSELMQQPDLSHPRTIEKGSRQQGRFPNTSEVNTKDS
jgi:hypothetical protein